MRIVLTGGGTGGHIFPNIAIFEEASKSERNLDFFYIGEKNGIEQEIIQKQKIPFFGIYCGKLRRYFSVKNLLDLFKLPIGILQSLYYLKKISPNIIFSKGGYVSVPVIIAGKILHIKIIIHDSDSIPGLTTKICAKYADTICLAYEEAKKHLSKNRRIVRTGIPLKKDNIDGESVKAYEITKFNKKTPVLLILGGSLGAKAINDVVYSSLPELVKHFQIIHLTGSGKNEEINLSSDLKKRYFTLEFTNQIADFYQITNFAISRAGANTIAELQTFGIPFLLIPLPKQASHGDQLENAKILEKEKKCLVLAQETLNPQTLQKKLDELVKNKQQFQYKEKIHINAAKTILDLITN
ncbi:MAG: UDP-diphospho-muramoylpentapeptide beta-N- acetylglucosaminyltransferase [Candidatus Peregrinibacteria bacterium GW2011_GWA2_33_10]|nr:MAG: UDP-diphospho-muramoylpentapeptide beta-N- acetylglucosaminyltransferase [Candidatus Peregrinibacteria bacterium GW2011_GWA2_33_10]